MPLVPMSDAGNPHPRRLSGPTTAPREETGLDKSRRMLGSPVFSQGNAESYLLLALVLIAFALRLWRLDVQDIWWDEARNIDVALRPMTAIPRAPELDIHPPGYFLLLHLWLILAGHTAFATRFLSTWFGVLLLPLLVALARRLRIPQAAPFAVLYAALSPFLIGEAQETRMYTLAFVLVALMGFYLWQVLVGHPRAWMGLGASTAAAVLVHYSTAFVAAALYTYGLLWAVASRTRAKYAPSAGQARAGWRQWLITPPLSHLAQAGLLSLVLFLPQAPRAYEQIAPYGNPNLVVPSLREYLAQLWKAYTVGMPLEGRAAMYGMGAIAVLFVGLAEWWRKRKGWTIGLLVWGVIVPILVYYAVLVQRATFAPRYISFVVPFLSLVLGAALAGWWCWHRALGLTWTALLVAFLALGVHADQFNPKYFREDTSGLARWLEEHTTSRDLVLIDVPYPLGFYYPRYSRSPQVPPPEAPAHIAPAYYLFVDIRRVDKQLTALARDKERIFWVQWFKSDTDPRGAVEFLLRKYGVHEGQKAFRGYRVDWYRIPRGTHFRVEENMTPTRVTFEERMVTVAIGAGQAPTLPAEVARASDEGLLPRPVWAVVDWQRVGEVSTPYKVSARLVDPLGHVVAQDDRRLISDRHLAAPYWALNERARNVYLLPLDVGTPPGVYTLTLRVYDPATLAPLSAWDAAKRPVGADAPVARVPITRPTTFPRVSPQALGSAPLSLVEFSLNVDEAAPGTVVPLSLLWVKQSAEGDPFRLRLALVGQNGQRYSVMETHPVPWYPTSEWRVGEVVRSRVDWRLAPETPNGVYRVRLSLLDGRGRSWGDVDLGTLRVQGRARHFQAPPPQHPLVPPPRFDDIALLLGYDQDGEIRPGARVAITLTWKALAPATVNYKVSLQVLDAAQRVLAQEDHIPLRGAAPTTSWLSGEILKDRFDLALPAQLPSGPKRVIVILYEEATLKRAPVLNSKGEVIGDYVELFTVE